MRRSTAALAAVALAGASLVAMSGPARAEDGDQIVPPPQSVAQDGTAVDLTGEVSVVAADDADDVALAALSEIVTEAGGTVAVSEEAPTSGVVVHLGQLGGEIDAALAAVGAEPDDELPAEGYQLASGEVDEADVLVLAGADARGSYYATQTLRQVLVDGVAQPLTVRDFPLMPIRGAIEGFYGIPWSHEARLDLLEFAGEHKLNTYIYTPKDDPLLRHEWRELYEGEDLERIGELVDQANANHVDFTFALSPGNDLCYSSDEDFEATIAKFEQLRELGVDSFYVALDDIPMAFHCDADEELYPGTDEEWERVAEAQTDYLNRIQEEWIEPNELLDLQTVPTNYNGSEEDRYKTAFGDNVNDAVRIQWTGEGVFSDTITVESVQRASQTYRTEHLYVWDNFPVNDGRRDRLFLNPLTGRAPELYEHIDGFTANPMIQPYASLPSLANYADYTWNGPDYDADDSMAAVLRELAGPDDEVQQALTAFADLNQLWPYRDDVVRAPALTADVEEFWAGYEADQDTSHALRDRLGVIQDLPQTLSQMAQPGFFRDTEPWVVAATQWAAALEHDADMLAATADDDGVLAADAFLSAQEQIALAGRATVDDQGEDAVLHENVIVPTVGDGVFDEFDADALAAFGDWLGVEPAPPVEGYPGSASSSMGTYETNEVDNMIDGDLDTLYWSDSAVTEGDYVQVDLGEEREVGRVSVHQADADDEGGDMFYDATLEYSLDGEEWSTLGEFQDSSLVVADLNEAVTARYVRMVANSANTGGQWAKIREFIVSPPSAQFAANLPSVDGAGVSRAFDGDVASAYQAAEAPVEGSFISYTFVEPRDVGSVTVLGTGEGEIEVEVDGEWITVGELADGVAFHEGELDATEATGVRLSFEPGSDAPEIYEVVAREGGPLGGGEEPTDPGTEEPTEDPDDPGTADPDDPGTDEPGGPGTEEPSGPDDGGPGDDGAGGPGDGGAGGELPSTGAGGTLALALGALLVAGVGAVLALRRRVIG